MITGGGLEEEAPYVPCFLADRVERSVVAVE